MRPSGPQQWVGSLPLLCHLPTIWGPESNSSRRSLSSAAYIKAYLLENGVCIAKKKTKVARKSLDPLYNQVLLFPESPQGKVLQVRGPEVCVCSSRGREGAPRRGGCLWRASPGGRRALWLI